MPADNLPTSAAPSAGARIAWATQSRRAHGQLSRLLAPHPLRLLGLAEGLFIRQQVLEHYRVATHAGHMLTQDLPHWDALAPALHQALQAVPGLQAPTAAADADWTLLVQDADTRGVYTLSANGFADRAAALLRWDGNSLLLAAPGLRSGVLLDCEVSDQGSVTLQLERWSADGWPG
ncbi:hypothetical protein KAK07_11890 [Ideonella sp. 4Y16]|uniref:hypothetical protein n=1 Tax=Ideonella alba TaxID=2824118 RepID=UPI001B3791B7|nr:hypothetical protein [Ideonella alba]MBQ0944036.1 hypothetical protein [Ideonella alba]